MRPIALVTGTSSGIGLHSAITLAQAGFSVIATLRNPQRAHDLSHAAQQAGVTIDIQAMDVQNEASVQECVHDVIARHGRIDLLLNNAGSGFFGTLEETSLAEAQNVMDVNFFGVWRVTQAVFPHMRAARSGRIITVTSIGGVLGQPFNDAYCAAKFAVEGFLESLAPVANRLGIHVSMIEPGAVVTEFVKNINQSHTGQAGESAATRHQNKFEGAYDAMRAAYLAAATQAYAQFSQTGAEIAQLIVDVAQAQSPHLRYPSSEGVRAVLAHKYTDLDGDKVRALCGARLG